MSHPHFRGLNMCFPEAWTFLSSCPLNKLCQNWKGDIFGLYWHVKNGWCWMTKTGNWLNSSICNVTMAIGIPMFQILPSMIPGSLQPSFILWMRWAKPGQLTLVSLLEDSVLKWTLKKVVLGSVKSFEESLGQRTQNRSLCSLKLGDKGEKSRLQWHQICLSISYVFTSVFITQELWALSSLMSNISLAA